MSFNSEFLNAEIGSRYRHESSGERAWIRVEGWQGPLRARRHRRLRTPAR